MNDFGKNKTLFYISPRTSYYIYGAFSENFFNTLVNYDKIGMRHSPVFYILRSLFINNEFLFKTNIIEKRFVNLRKQICKKFQNLEKK